MIDLQLRESLVRFLSSLGNDGAVLKNPDIWRSLETGGDWDLIVADRRQAISLLYDTVGFPVRLVNRSYVTSLFYPWGSVDVLPGLYWRSIRLLDPRDVLGRSSASSEAVRVASIADQAVAGWFAPLLAYGTFKDRYMSIVESAMVEPGAVFRSILSGLVGERLAVASVQRTLFGRLRPSEVAFLRMAVVVRACVSRPSSVGLDSFRLLRAEWILRWCPSVPAVSVLATDDSKTFVDAVLAAGLGITGVAIESPLEDRVSAGRGMNRGRVLYIDGLGGLRYWARRRKYQARGWICVVRDRRGCSTAVGPFAGSRSTIKYAGDDATIREVSGYQNRIVAKVSRQLLE